MSEIYIITNEDLLCSNNLDEAKNIALQFINKRCEHQLKL